MSVGTYTFIVRDACGERKTKERDVLRVNEGNSRLRELPRRTDTIFKYRGGFITL